MANSKESGRIFAKVLNCLCLFACLFASGVLAAQEPQDGDHGKDLEWLLDQLFEDENEKSVQHVGVYRSLTVRPLVLKRPEETRWAAGGGSWSEPSVWNTFPDLVPSQAIVEGWPSGMREPNFHPNGSSTIEQAFGAFNGFHSQRVNDLSVSNVNAAFYWVTPDLFDHFRAKFESYRDPDNLAPTISEASERCIYFRTYSPGGRYSELTALYADSNNDFSSYDEDDLTCFLSFLSANLGFVTDPDLAKYTPTQDNVGDQKCYDRGTVLQKDGAATGRNVDQLFFCLRRAERLHVILAYVDALSKLPVGQLITRAQMRERIVEVLDRDNRWVSVMKGVNDSISAGMSDPSEFPPLRVGKSITCPAGVDPFEDPSKCSEPK